MPAVIMRVQNRGGMTGATFQHSEILNAPGPGEWIFYPKGTTTLSIIFKAGGVGRLEATNDSQENIEAGTVDPNSISISPDGEISATTISRAIVTANAFRQVNISGQTNLFAFAN